LFVSKQSIHRSVDLGYPGLSDVSFVETEIAEIQKMIAAIQRKLAPKKSG
jgi:hypothetical protein